MLIFKGPATIDCKEKCDVPEGVELTEIPPSRHSWSDVLVCPHKGCPKMFLVTELDKEVINNDSQPDRDS